MTRHSRLAKVLVTWLAQNGRRTSSEPTPDIGTTFGRGAMLLGAGTRVAGSGRGLRATGVFSSLPEGFVGGSGEGVFCILL